MASFKLYGLGLSLGAKLISATDRPSMFSIMFKLSPSGSENTKCAALCTIRLDVLQGMSVEIVARTIEDLIFLCSTPSRRMYLKKWIIL